MALSSMDLVAYFGKLLSPELFDDYGPNGLQVEGKSSVKKVAFAVSATQESIKEALAWGADALVVHHGILWKHQGARTVTGAWGERLRLCLKNDLNLLAYHLPLDAHAEVGNAAALGRELGLVDPAPFGLYKRQPLGVKGRVPVPVRARELKLKLEALLRHPVILASPDPEGPIGTIGIITGGANNNWTEAQEANLDAYLTGEISEYNWHDAIEAGLHYFAGGHHATERFGVLALQERLDRDQPNLTTRFFDSSNPA